MATKDRSEIALLAVFLIVAVAFTGLTATFRAESATLFPRLTGAVIIAGVAVTLLEDRLPEPLRRVVAEPVNLVDREEFEENEEDKRIASTETEEPQRPLTSRQFLYTAISGYVGLAYVISILLATPLFVAAYGYWNDQRPLYIAVLTTVSIGICLTFVWLANAPVDRGLLFPQGVV